jgi:hypothetical protein
VAHRSVKDTAPLLTNPGDGACTSPAETQANPHPQPRDSPRRHRAALLLPLKMPAECLANASLLEVRLPQQCRLADDKHQRDRSGYCNKQVRQGGHGRRPVLEPMIVELGIPGNRENTPCRAPITNRVAADSFKMPSCTSHKSFCSSCWRQI